MIPMSAEKTPVAAMRQGLRRGRALGRLLLSFGLTGLFGWWAFHDLHWADMWASLRTANFLWLVPHVMLLQCVHWLRALRWGSLLSGLERVRFGPLNASTAVGNMLFVLLPLRLGEFARPVLISRRSSIRASAALTSVVLERIIDGVAIALLLEGTLWWLGDSTETLRYLRWGSHLMLAGFLGLWGLLLLAYWQRALAVRWVRLGLGWLSPGLADRVAGLMDSFVGAVRQVSGLRQFVSTALLTVALWTLNSMSIMVLSYAFDCSNQTGSCTPLTLDLFQSFVVLGVTVLVSMIPAAPGMAGTYQAGAKMGLSLFVAPAVLTGTGLAFANVMWLATVLHQVGLGLLTLARGTVTMEGLFSPPSVSPESPAGPR